MNNTSVTFIYIIGNFLNQLLMNLGQNENIKLNKQAYSELQKWKNSTNRKPLLVRGVRQVGKITLVRQFAKKVDKYIELNL